MGDLLHSQRCTLNALSYKDSALRGIAHIFLLHKRYLYHDTLQTLQDSTTSGRYAYSGATQWLLQQ